MSTRGSTWCDDQPDDMDWTPTPKPWCTTHCTPTCGCTPTDLEALRAPHHEGMGCE